MKTLLTSILFFFAIATFAQKSDTLTIPVGKYKFIKVGDKVYKLNTTLEEVKEEAPSMFFDGIHTEAGTSAGPWMFKPSGNYSVDSTNNIYSPIKKP